MALCSRCRACLCKPCDGTGNRWNPPGSWPRTRKCESCAGTGIAPDPERPRVPGWSALLSLTLMCVIGYAAGTSMRGGGAWNDVANVFAAMLMCAPMLDTIANYLKQLGERLARH